MKQIVGKRIFFHCIRTAIIFVAGFIMYDILKKLENDWNKMNPGNKISNFSKRNTLKFIFIFFVDFIILYVFFLFFDILL